MKKLIYLSGFVLFVSFGILINDQCCKIPVQDNERKMNEKLFPYDFFYFQRSYPDANLDIKAYKKVMIEVSESMSSRGIQESNVAWQNEGPNNIGGRINAVVAHPDNADIMYVGTTAGGVFKTVDGGENWYPVFDDNPFLATSCITFDPDDPDIIYVGTGDRNISGYPMVGDGVYRSEDAGETWTHLGLSEQSIVSKIVVDPTNTETIYAATMGLPFEKNEERGLYKSTDGGNTWTQSLFISDSAGVIDLVMDPYNSQILYAAGWNRIRNAFYSLVSGPASKIYKTTNGGESWTILTGGLPQENLSRPGLAISQKTPGTVFALFVGNDYNLHSIHKSIDDGASWMEVGTSNLPNDYLGGFGWYFGQIRVNPENDDELYVLGVDLHKTNTGGDSWFQASPPWYFYEVHADKHDLFFVDENTLLLSTDGGLYKSENGGEDWEDIEDIPNSQFYRVKVNHHNPDIYFGGLQDNGTVSGNHNTQNDWDRIYGGDGFQPLFDKFNESTFYVETQNGNLAATTNNGYDWYDFNNGIDYGDPRSWDMPIARNEMNTYFAGTNRMYKNENAPFGTWSPISGILTDGTPSRYHVISTIGTSAIDPEMVYVGTTDAFVWRSLDGGKIWTEITGDLPNRYVTAVRPSPNFDNAVYVSHSGYKMNDYIPRIHRSADNGDSWVDISGDLPDFAVNDVAILWDHSDSVVFAATDGGVYTTLNGGNHWFRLGNNMPVVPVYDIEINQESNVLIAGTHARSMMSFPIDSLVIVTGLKEQFTNQNLSLYPNPATTFITIELTEEGFNGTSNVSVFDMNGRQVQTDFIKESSNQLDVSALTKGTYILKIQNGQSVLSQRFVKVD